MPPNSLSGREIVVGVSGGVAAFKTAALVSQLVQAGASVTVAMTAAAEKFVGRATFAALTGRAVATEVFDAAYPLGAHIMLAEQAAVLCIAPASADFLAHAAQGFAPDLLSTLWLAFAGPTVVAPAMNSAMWSKPAVQRNVAQLRSDGVQIIDPDSGWLSCRQVGAGRMADPERIFAALVQVCETLPRRA